MIANGPKKLFTGEIRKWYSPDDEHSMTANREKQSLWCLIQERFSYKLKWSDETMRFRKRTDMKRKKQSKTQWKWRSKKRIVLSHNGWRRVDYWPCWSPLAATPTPHNRCPANVPTSCYTTNFCKDIKQQKLQMHPFGGSNPGVFSDCGRKVPLPPHSQVLAATTTSHSHYHHVNSSTSSTEPEVTKACSRTWPPNSSIHTIYMGK